MIKRIALLTVLFLVAGFFMSGCVSRDEETSEQSVNTLATVPGEKVPDQGAYSPGAPGSSGSVHW